MTFKDWDGSVISSQAVEAGITATKPIDPTRTSYAFDGWYKETAYTNRWDFNMGVVTTNITLYAKWKWTPSNDVVTWDGKVDVSWYNSSQMQFIIITAEQLAGLSQLVNNGANNFEGKTITLGNNIELNDTTDWQNWENNAPANSWTAIGSSSSNSFRGTFD
ncbi:MAG: InlB B-repeat-containing protein, partial [Treponema sp.]|nr:InlB B-repeat-containing protein [Treponema sp.]